MKATRYYFETRNRRLDPRSFVAEGNDQAISHLRKIEPKAVLLYTDTKDGFKVIWGMHGVEL